MALFSFETYLVRKGMALLFSCFRLSIAVILLFGCKKNATQPPLFSVLQQDRTGLHFRNDLKASPQFNMFTYMYFYNGAGVGAGDFDNDGKIDLFFAANQGDNKLYKNKGNLQFEDITTAAQIPNDGGWSTGVSVIDINSDGLLDIYVCRVSNFEGLKAANQLLINQGIKNGVPAFKEEAAQYGLAFSGFSTQAAFFDYDKDGDLDCYLLNHSVHQNGTFAERKQFIGTYHPLTGDRLYRNDSGSPLDNKVAAIFTDVTKECGINSSAIGYGLGIAVSDINNDGWPDLYIGNDFHENDYLYINKKDGTFSEELTQRITSTSKFSMGVDVADINNDALPEIIAMDMLPADPYMLKRSLGEDDYDIFQMKLKFGYHPQAPRNTLQLQLPNGMFSEVGRWAGVYATDWSWAPLWMDFDNDGWKDLFISNGIPRRLNDIDYVAYVSAEDVQQRINAKTVNEKELAAADNFPQIKLPNKLYRNRGQVQFQDEANLVEGDAPTFSNGAVYADLDGDGDLDIVVNNIDDAAIIYQNHSNDNGSKPFLQLRLQGPINNRTAIGAKAVVYAGSEVRTYEHYPVRGFQSSMEVPLHIGLAGNKTDSLILIWPDGTYQKLDTSWRGLQKVAYKTGLPLFSFETIVNRFKPQPYPATDITAKTGLAFRHTENPFVEFDREPLIPHMVSREGPALAVADINGDRLDDVFIGSAKGAKSAVFVQSKGGRFSQMRQPALEVDSMYEESDAAWADVNGDGHPDLLLAPGGNEYFGGSVNQQPQLYLNDGKGVLTRKEDAFKDLYLTASCILPHDFTGDGIIDLFVGGRAVPWAYGQTPQSYLLEGDGSGNFKEVTATYNRDLGNVGFVTSGSWTDLDNDGNKDLLLTLEWGGIVAFVKNGNGFAKKTITENKGWWHFALPVDVDGDGDLDLVAGNLGQNNRLKPNAEQPVRMYFNDFDGNGQKEQVLTYYLQGREIPFANKGEIDKQLAVLKKKFLYAGDFAKASLQQIFDPEKLAQAEQLTLNYSSNVVLVNEGNWKFTLKPLPWQAQLTTYRDAAVIDANGDKLPDILPVGNFWDANIQMGRYDADWGSVWINKGKGNFAVEPINGLTIKGQVRKVRPAVINQQKAYVLARNNDSTMVIQFDKP